jgi:3D (Asp-Asp-Asp) domain-containing protein
MSIKTVLSMLCCSLAMVCYYQFNNPVIIEKEVVKQVYMPVKQSQSFIAECTAYTEGFESCGKLPNHPAYGITASGKRVAVGMIAADTRILPFGTKVYIDGMGIYTVEDTGGAIKGNCIDIYMPRLEDAIKFGRQHRKLIVLN